jgi:hypothetical protein
VLSVEKSIVASATVAPGLLVLALYFVLAPILVPGGGIVRFPRVIHLYLARAVAFRGARYVTCTLSPCRPRYRRRPVLRISNYMKNDGRQFTGVQAMDGAAKPHTRPQRRAGAGAIATCTNTRSLCASCAVTPGKYHIYMTTIMLGGDPAWRIWRWRGAGRSVAPSLPPRRRRVASWRKCNKLLIRFLQKCHT